MINTLVKQELIDLLCFKRCAFISLMSQQVTLIKNSYQLCAEMDSMIPAHAHANHDYLDVVFYHFKSLMGENVRGSLPKDVNILRMSEANCTKLFTKVLDENLWLILFNRLNVYSLMSSRSRKAFKAQINVSPLEFNPNNISSTLADILSRKDELLLDGLIESIQDADQVYMSNDKFQFNNKIIFSDVIFKYGCHLKLRDAGGFKDVITFLSQVVFGHKTILSVDSTIKDTYLWELMNGYFIEEELEELNRDVIAFDGGKVTFFNNGNAHMVLDKPLVDFLNQQLSKSNGLKHAA